MSGSPRRIFLIPTRCLTNPSEACFPDLLGKLVAVRGQWALILRSGVVRRPVPIVLLAQVNGDRLGDKMNTN
jgi:hypothetical protein